MKNKAFDKSKYALWIDPNEVKPYERNAKIHTPEQIKNIANSIRRFGWQQDTVLTTDNVLVIGHGRRLAAIELGCEMPYHVIDKTADDLTDEQIKALRLADNKTNESEWDFDILGGELDDIFDIDMSEFGFFDVNELPPIPDNLDADDEYNEESPLAVKLTFSNYTAYSMYEREIKETAERMGATFALVKA